MNLRDTVTVVTGASRGAGRGIALALGERGATVYVTGRSVTGQATTDNLPGTIEETAESVTVRGGAGLAVRCDRTVDAEVEALFERISKERGRLDLLVNCAWGGYEVTNIFYATAKAAINRMSFGMSKELKKHHIAVVALAPGFMRTERVAAAFNAAGVKGLENFTESTEYVGRAVAALASDANVFDKSGQLLVVGNLAKEYGFTDIDGRLVPPFKMPDDYPYR